ncbi:hypothetical protein KDA_66120 [Dictyobacter alpinus]|uniref:PPM-type phosphatase domain-containing protein n=1 Tax=Dictyobacter alpinus TaxID=2014873 RepID=A0A402BI94_9CHLR|nr:protein phosphatase 2C domain-containing protein [Dictyobacter alpinus]GCE31128.1 hypothetical protein KDA_66120 [Dictyobacter alpinus]
MMSEKLKDAYRQYRWVKLVALAGLVLGGLLLLVCSGGFPPWAWRFLVQVLPQIPILWQMQGAAMLLPLVGLCLLSLSLLVLWIVIGILLVKVIKHIWNDFQTRPTSFADDLREAELMAEQAVQDQELAEEEEAPAPMPMRTRSTATLAQPSRPYQQPATRQPRSSRPSQDPQTQPVPAARQAAYASAPREISFPGLSYPTPVYHATGNSPAAPAVNRRTTDLRQPSYPQTQPIQQDDLPEYPTTPARSSRRPLRSVPPAALRERPDTSEDVDVEHAFAEMAERAERQQAEREQQQAAYKRQQFELQQAEYARQQFEQEQAEYARQQLEQEQAEYEDEPFEQEPEAYGQQQLEQEDGLDVDLWETRPGDFEDDDIDLAQYDTLAGLDDTMPGSERVARMQAQVADSGEFDFDQQQYLPPAKKVRTGPVATTTTADAAPRFVVGIGLDPGLARKDSPNEDSLFAIQGIRVTDEGSKPAGLFMVADGMGGHANGREASRTAIHAISDVIAPALLRDVSGSSAKEEKTLFQDMLKDGVHQANLALYRRNRERTRMMGTTITAALVVDRMAYIVNVGDSRTYLYRSNQGLTQITHDHSVVARLVEDGVITRDEVYTHPQRNQIYRCLGEHASVEIDSFAIPLQVNDILLLCSDGLWEMIRDPAIEKIIASSAHNPSQMSAMLVQAALNHGGADNISVIAVGLTSGDDADNWML